RADAYSSGLPVRGEQHDGEGDDVRQQAGESLDGSTPARGIGDIERDVVVRAEARELDLLVVHSLPGIELFAEEANGFPQGTPGACRASGTKLDGRRRDLDPARVEVHGAASRQ